MRATTIYIYIYSNYVALLILYFISYFFFKLDDVINFIHKKGCIGFCIRNINSFAKKHPPLDITEILVALTCCLKVPLLIKHKNIYSYFKMLPTSTLDTYVCDDGIHVVLMFYSLTLIFYSLRVINPDLLCKLMILA